MLFNIDKFIGIRRGSQSEGVLSADTVDFLCLNREWDHTTKGNGSMWEVEICLRELINNMPECPTLCHAQLEVGFNVVPADGSKKVECAVLVDVQNHNRVKYSIPCPKYEERLL